MLPNTSVMNGRRFPGLMTGGLVFNRPPMNTCEGLKIRNADFQETSTQANLLYELQIGNIVLLRLENFEDNGLALDFILVQHLPGLLWYQSVPFLIGIWEAALLE